jgi:uncharacterized protein with beta-barrel porin domain
MGNLPARPAEMMAHRNNGERGRRQALRAALPLLVSTSIGALLVGGGTGPAMAACANTVGPGASASYTNPTGTVIPCVLFQGATISGNVVNAGTISGAGNNGMEFTNSGGNATTILGAVSNAGSISVSTGAGIIAGPGNATLLGGITNSGTISTTDVFDHGIFVTGATFAGGVTNAGVISAAGNAIDVGSTSVFSGGITNAGAGKITTAITGIFVDGSAGLSFNGNISNAGTITALRGIVANGETTGGSRRFTNLSGAVINSGTIAAADTGITVSGVSTFTGGVTNTGAVTATAGVGILVNGRFGTPATPAGLSYTGGIVSSGTIQAGTIGIELTAVSNFSGGITSSSISAAATAISVSQVSVFSGGITTSGTLQGTKGVFVDTHTVLTINGDIVNNGTITATAGTGIALSSISTIATFNGNVTNNGTVTATGGTAILIHADFNNGGLLNNGVLSSSNAFGFAAIGTNFGSASFGIVNASNATINGGGLAAIFLAAGTFTGGFTNNGTITAANGDGVLATAVGVSTYSGGFTNTGTITAKTGLNVSAQTFNGLIVNSGNITGTGGTAVKIGGDFNPVTFDQEGGTIAGALILTSAVSGDVLNVSGGVVQGKMSDSNGTGALTFNLGSGTFTYGSGFHFSGFPDVNVNSGTVILDGAGNTATTTTVSGGTLQVGDAASPGATLTSAVDVTGGTLSGHGTITGAVTIAGGTLAPGGSIGTLNVVGSVSFTSGNYDVTINDTSASKTSVTGAPGTFTIASGGTGGTVVVTPQFTTLGPHGGTSYVIVSTTGGVSGRFASVTENGSFTGALALDYSNPDEIILDVGNGFEVLPTPLGANQNERNVITGINDFILAGGTPPAGFQTLGGLSGQTYLNALTQLDGEDATGAEKGAFQLMTQFLDLLLDPSQSGAGGGSGGSAPGFAEENQASLPPDVALAYAHALRQKDQPPQDFNQRWSAWGSGYGGSGSYSGNATIGSSNLTATDYGYAAGMTYHLTPQTSYGFALAGGGTNWSLSQSLGTGRSDAFQAGVYGTTHFGAAYMQAAVAFANHWFSTNRFAEGDNLTAHFMGQSYAARGEVGYRYGLPVTGTIVGITPYAAVQVQDFHTPGYSETDASGGGFGLNYAAVNATDTRSELGSRFDNLTILDGMPLVLRGRLAWAHDWVSNPAVSAVFQTLPGSNFIVTGAAVPSNSALTTAAAELHINANWSATAKFDGEFASHAQTYAGTGLLKYSW